VKQGCGGGSQSFEVFGYGTAVKVGWGRWLWGRSGCISSSARNGGNGIVFSSRPARIMRFWQSRNTGWPRGWISHCSAFAAVVLLYWNGWITHDFVEQRTDRNRSLSADHEFP